MALSCLYAYLDIESDPYYDGVETNYAPLFTGLIAGGVAIGALVGMASPKWTNVALPRRKSANSSLRFTPVIGSQYDYYAVNLKFKF